MYRGVVGGESRVFCHRQLLRQALDRADAVHQRATGARCLRRAEHRGAALLGEPLRVPGRIGERTHERQRDDCKTGQQQAKKRSRVRHVLIIPTEFPLARGSMSRNAEPRIYLVAAVAANGIIGADGLVMTEIHRDYRGDSWFPRYDRSRWREAQREAHTAADGTKLDFVRYERA